MRRDAEDFLHHHDAALGLARGFREIGADAVRAGGHEVDAFAHGGSPKSRSSQRTTRGRFLRGFPEPRAPGPAKIVGPHSSLLSHARTLAKNRFREPRLP